MRKKRAHAQIRIHSLDVRCVDSAVRFHGDGSVLNALCGHGAGNRASRVHGLPHGGGATIPQLRRDFVGQHLLQSEAEQVRGIPAVGPRYYISTETRGATRPAVASGTAIRQSRANTQVFPEVSGTVSRIEGAFGSVQVLEFSLEELPSPANGAERIALNHECRRIRGIPIPSARPNLLREGLSDPLIERIGSQRAIDQLAAAACGPEMCGCEKTTRNDNVFHVRVSNHT